MIVWAAFKWLPNDEKAIRMLMTRLTETASVTREDSGFARLAYGDRLASFFTTNATLQVDGFGEFSVIGNRTELIQAAMAARSQLREAEFRIAKLNVSFPGERGTAMAYVVILGRINSDTNEFGQAFRMALRKVRGRWLIEEVNTIERLQ